MRNLLCLLLVWAVLPACVAEDEVDSTDPTYELEDSASAGTVTRHYCNRRDNLQSDTTLGHFVSARACVSAPGKDTLCNSWYNMPYQTDRICTPWMRGPLECDWHLNWWVAYPTPTGPEWEHAFQTDSCGEAMNPVYPYDQLDDRDPSQDENSVVERVAAGPGRVRARYCREWQWVAQYLYAPGDVTSCIRAPGQAESCKHEVDVPYGATRRFCTPWVEGAVGCNWDLTWSSSGRVAVSTHVCVRQPAN